MKILFPVALLGLTACVETPVETAAATPSEPAARAELNTPTGYTVQRKNGVTMIVGSLQ